MNHRLMTLVLSTLLSPLLNAQTAWPAFMPRLQPGLSESPAPAVLPSGSEPVLPDASLPLERSRWHGLWHGWACAGMQCDVRIAIEQVSAQHATVAFASASAVQGTMAERGSGNFENEDLIVPLAGSTRLVMRLRGDGDMEMAYWKPETQLVSVGVLTQRPLQSIYSRTVERVTTPWKDGAKVQTLEMVVYRPLGTGPFPTLIFNHGSTGDGTRPDWFTFTSTSPDIARYFTNKGWQVMFPQRRGRGQSDGLYDEGFAPDRTKGYTCEPRRAIAGFDRAVADLDVVMAHVLARKDIDTHRLMIGGVSRGGILSVAYAGMHPETFKGVLNFVGGWLGDACTRANEVNPALMRRGASFKQPMLWMYGDHDPYYTLAHSRATYNDFIASGGTAEFLVFQPAAGRNGHQLHVEPSIWTEAVDNYLAKVNKK